MPLRGSATFLLMILMHETCSLALRLRALASWRTTISGTEWPPVAGSLRGLFHPARCTEHAKSNLCSHTPFGGGVIHKNQQP